MKTRLQKSMFILAILALLTSYGYAQVNGFVLTPSGTTDNFMKYVPKIQPYNGTNYITGFLTLSAYQVQLGNNYDPGTPVQKLQLMGGNILLCKTINSVNIPDFNPTSRNGAILFSDIVTNTYKHGKWGIEYESELSVGGLNFFNPVSQLFDERRNFNLFLSNTGNVGIGSGEPVAKLQVKDGDIFIEDINRGIIMKSPDGNCWRGVLNNQGQLEFVLLPDCSGTLVSSQQIETKPGINISPNPATGFIRISCTAEDLTKFSSFKIMDASGREANTYNLDSVNTQIETNNLKPGIYFINFIGKNAYWTEKVVVQ